MSDYDYGPEVFLVSVFYESPWDRLCRLAILLGGDPERDRLGWLVGWLDKRGRAWDRKWAHRRLQGREPPARYRRLGGRR